MPYRTENLLHTAKELGFELAGVAASDAPLHFAEYEEWLQCGCHAGMEYLARHKNARRHPDAVLQGTKSLLLLGVSYRAVLCDEAGSKTGTHSISQLSGIAEYARGMDYHDWIRERLNILSQKHRELFPSEQCRGVVDTAPILERDFAVAAGLGQIGKNTMLIHTNRDAKLGSKFFLAALLSTAFLSQKWNAGTCSHENSSENPCGNCRACLDACPTGALSRPFWLDARRCLNFWTIEQRGEIPHEISQCQGALFFGCDLCQKVCPWNDNVPTIPPGTIDPHVFSQADLRQIAKGTPLSRHFSP